jgi:putative nucleotidyltransferase with HDIG domain
MLSEMNTDFVLVKNSLLNLYRKIPFYYQVVNDDFALYKPAGITLSEMRIREQLHPKQLYIKRRNKIEAIQEVQNEFNKELKKCVQQKDLTKVRGIVQDIVKVTLEEPTSGSLEGISKTVNILVGEVTKNKDIIKLLLDITTRDYTTTRHSVNVMALALGYASYVNYDWYNKKILGLAALLHDVGKVRISGELLKAARKLTDEEFKEIQKHPIKGYQILNTCKFPNNEIKITALEHHEKLDGSGYPRRKTNISEFAQVVSIIDCYEALTNDERVYRKATNPLGALEIIKTDIVDAGKFSKEIFKNFAYSLLQVYRQPQYPYTPLQ